MARLITSTLANRSLDVIIEQKGLLDSISLKKLIEKARTNNQRLEEILVKEGGLDKEIVYKALAESYRLPFNDCENIISQEDLPERLAGICQRESLKVIDFSDQSIIVATSQPDRLKTVEALFSALGFTIDFQICAPGSKKSATDNVADDSLQNDLFSGINDLVMTLNEDVDLSHRVGKSNDISISGDVSSLVDLVNKTLLLAVHQRASDIHIESTQNGVKVRFRIDGVLVDRFEIEGNTASTFVSRLLIMSELDITEKVMPQDGSFKVTCEDRDVEFRIACIPGIYGQPFASNI